MMMNIKASPVMSKRPIFGGPSWRMMRLVVVAPLLQLLVLAVAAAAAGEQQVIEQPVSIVDLSLPSFEKSPLMNDSPGASTILEGAKSDEELRSLLILEDGKVVVDYSRPGTDFSGDGSTNVVDPLEPFPVWSATKSWMSLMIGLLIQEGVVNIDETLEELFPDQEDLWSNNSSNMSQDMEFRKAVTLKELLTMTSGLQSNWQEDLQDVDENENPNEEGAAEIAQEIQATTEDEDEEEPVDVWGDLGVSGGATLRDAITEPIVGAKEFSYLGTNNMLSYIVPRRTNYSSPKEYMADRVFPYLGMSTDDMEWWRNADKMEYSYHGMVLTTTQLVKLGQLYLQGGKTNSTHQLINKEWVTQSTSLQGGNFFYGYLWWVFMGAIFEQPELGTVYCAQGLGGQTVCVSPTTKRVAAHQKDLGDNAMEEDPNTLLLQALHPNILFNVSSTDAQADANANNNSPVEEDSPGNQISNAGFKLSSSFCGWSTVILLLLLGQAWIL